MQKGNSNASAVLIVLVIFVLGWAAFYYYSYGPINLGNLFGF